MSDITRILAGMRDQDRRDAMERLAPLLYDELRALAQSHLNRERPEHTLQATALVNEAYLRLLGKSQPPWNDRTHFFRAAAEAMRRILVDHARARGRIKRGGDQVRVELRDSLIGDAHDLDEVLALDDAFRRLDEQDPRAADVVRLRYFAGLSVADTARALDTSERTVKRDWAFARAWLFDELRDADG
jgi:RNA polymerase sigma factor (TIGR02999 family)